MSQEITIASTFALANNFYSFLFFPFSLIIISILINFKYFKTAKIFFGVNLFVFTVLNFIDYALVKTSDEFGLRPTDTSIKLFNNLVESIDFFGYLVVLIFMATLFFKSLALMFTAKSKIFEFKSFKDFQKKVIDNRVAIFKFVYPHLLAFFVAIFAFPATYILISIISLSFLR